MLKSYKTFFSLLLSKLEKARVFVLNCVRNLQCIGDKYKLHFIIIPKGIHGFKKIFSLLDKAKIR
jgi:hypothetical protein